MKFLRKLLEKELVEYKGFVYYIVYYEVLWFDKKSIFVRIIFNLFFVY